MIDAKIQSKTQKKEAIRRGSEKNYTIDTNTQSKIERKKKGKKGEMQQER